MVAAGACVEGQPNAGHENQVGYSLVPGYSNLCLLPTLFESIYVARCQMVVVIGVRVGGGGCK